MSQAIDPTLASAVAPQARSAPATGPAQEGSSFLDLVSDAIEDANHEQVDAEKEARALAAGKGDIVDAMVALSRADLALRFVVTLRNRAMEAYQEIMRLQV